MKRFAALLITVSMALLPVLSGCAQKAADGGDRLMVAVSIVPERTFMEAVGGDLIDVVVMIPPGHSPENYAPTPQQMEELSDASLYFSIGVPTEAANILPMAASLNDVKIISLQEEVAQAYPMRMAGEGTPDPHIWLSPRRAVVMIEAIARELSALDPQHQDIYRQNADDYIAQLNALDADIRGALQGMENKTIIVYHPAFGYFADDYGLDMIALEQEGKPAAAQDFQEALSTARAEGIKVIFYQEEFDSRQAETFASEIGGEAVKVAPLSPDYIDNLRQTADAFARVR